MLIETLLAWLFGETTNTNPDPTVNAGAELDPNGRP